MTTVIERSAISVSFVEPLPGFAEDSFTLSAIDPHGMLCSLRADHLPGLRFVLTPSPVFFPDYRPRLAEALAEVLGSPEVEVLLMLTLGSGLTDATANLRAPVVYAPATGRAVQVILDDETLPMHAPLPTVPPAA